VEQVDGCGHALRAYDREELFLRRHSLLRGRVEGEEQPAQYKRATGPVGSHSPASIPVEELVQDMSEHRRADVGRAR
jgi:hypothetical protein